MSVHYELDELLIICGPPSTAPERRNALDLCNSQV